MFYRAKVDLFINWFVAHDAPVTRDPQFLAILHNVFSADVYNFKHCPFFCFIYASVDSDTLSPDRLVFPEPGVNG